jgi:hypothetical protein
VLLTPAVRGILTGKHTSLLAYILSAAYIRPFHSSAAAFIVSRPVQRASASILQDANTLAIPVPRNHGRSYVVELWIPACPIHAHMCYVRCCALSFGLPGPGHEGGSPGRGVSVESTFRHRGSKSKIRRSCWCVGHEEGVTERVDRQSHQLSRLSVCCPSISSLGGALAGGGQKPD